MVTILEQFWPLIAYRFIKIMWLRYRQLLCTATEAEIQALRHSSASAGLIVVVVVVLLAVVVIALDLTCYFVNKRGIIMVLRQRFAPANTTRGSTEKALEDGEKYVFIRSHSARLLQINAEADPSQNSEAIWTAKRDMITFASSLTCKWPLTSPLKRGSTCSRSRE